MGNHTAIAVDVAKNVFELGISDRPGVVRRKERLQRSQFLPFLAAQAASRHLASYLGLTPRERSSGNTRRLGGITKRGDIYLRTLLVHGARSVLARAKQIPASGRRDRLREWAAKVEKARGHNKAAVALANKMARLVWAVWRHECEYRPAPVAA